MDDLEELISNFNRGRPKDFKKIIQILRSPDSRLRTFVLKNIWRGSVEIQESLISILAHDPIDEVRREVPRLLVHVCSNDVLEALLAALQDRDIYVRQAAVKSLGDFNNPSVEDNMQRRTPYNNIAIKGLLSALEDTHQMVRKAAAESLGNVRLLQVGGSFGVSYPSCLDIDKERNTVINSLLPLLDDSSLAVREKVAKSLSKIGGSSAIKALFEKAIRQTGSHMQILLDTLVMSPDPLSNPFIVATLNHHNPKIQVAAALAVKNSAEYPELGLDLRPAWLNLENSDIRVSVGQMVKILIEELTRLSIDSESQVRASASLALRAIRKRLEHQRMLGPSQVCYDMIDTSSELRELPEPQFQKELPEEKLAEIGIRAFQDYEEEHRTETVLFTVSHPQNLLSSKWYSLFVYVHSAGKEKFILQDIEKRLVGEGAEHLLAESESTGRIVTGTKITIVPELEGCRFNPQRILLTWEEDVHCCEFRVKAISDHSFFDFNTAVNGRVVFYAGPILIGEVRICSLLLSEKNREQYRKPEVTTAYPFHSVFVSYSHNDASIVDALEKAYSVLGMKYLRDINVLRSGEKWTEALLTKIEQADIFQLCWSQAANLSMYVKQEWRYALDLDRNHFIRPVYWEEPMIPPPPELKHLHFAFLELR